VQRLPCREFLQRRSPKDVFEKNRIARVSEDRAAQGYLRSAILMWVPLGCNLSIKGAHVSVKVRRYGTALTLTRERQRIWTFRVVAWFSRLFLRSVSP
jgi:hypothetical protein